MPQFVIRAFAHSTYCFNDLTQLTRATQPCGEDKNDCIMHLDKVIYDSKGKSLSLSNIARAQHQSPKPSPMLRHSLPSNFNHRISISIFRSVANVHVWGWDRRRFQTHCALSGRRRWGAGLRVPRGGLEQTGACMERFSRMLCEVKVKIKTVSLGGLGGR